MVDEQRPGFQPGFLEAAYGVVGVPSNVTLTGTNFAPTPHLRCEFHQSSAMAEAGTEAAMTVEAMTC